MDPVEKLPTIPQREKAYIQVLLGSIDPRVSRVEQEDYSGLLETLESEEAALFLENSTSAGPRILALHS